MKLGNPFNDPGKRIFIVMVLIGIGAVGIYSFYSLPLVLGSLSVPNTYQPSINSASVGSSTENWFTMITSWFGKYSSSTSTVSSLGGTVDSLNGIYLVANVSQGDSLATSQKNRDFSDAMANQYINGAYLKDSWSDIETADGTYDWSKLDAQVKIAESAGKKVALGIQAGVDTPAWVYSEGAQPFQTVATESAQGNFCQQESVPVPWDPVFLKKWSAFVVAFGAHYANDPHVVEIKITGINQTTDETSMPNSIGSSKTEKHGSQKGTNCTLPDDNANWIAAGYTQQKVFDAWKQIASSFARAFPKQSITTMTSVNSMPLIDAHGQYDPTGAAGSLASYTFLPYGATTFGMRFTAAQNGWRPNHLDVGVVNFGKTTGNPIGWQPSWPIDCYENSKRVAIGSGDCTERLAVEQLFQVGLQSNPTYLELLLPISGTNDYNDLIQKAYAQIMAKVSSK